MLGRWGDFCKELVRKKGKANVGCFSQKVEVVKVSCQRVTNWKPEQSGKTMVEMLLVFGVMTLLTIGILKVYRRVIDDQKATALYNDIRVRSVLYSERRQNGKGTIIEKSSYGLVLSLTENQPVPGYYLIKAEGLNKSLCERLLKKEWPITVGDKAKARIYINDALYQSGVTECPNGTSSFSVAYRSAKASSKQTLPKACTQSNANSVCESCEKCMNGECQSNCSNGLFCAKDFDDLTKSAECYPISNIVNGIYCVHTDALGHCDNSDKIDPCDGQLVSGCVKSFQAVAGECVIEYQSEGYVCDANKKCNAVHECVCTGYMKDGVCKTCPDHAECNGGTSFACDEENGWYEKDGGCALYEFTCPVNSFQTRDNGCQSCYELNGYWVDNKMDCMACAKTANPRVMDALRSVCGRKECPNSYFKENGWCTACSQSGARLVDDSITKCETTCSNRKLVGSWCANQSCGVAGNGQFFYQSKLTEDNYKPHEAVCASCSIKNDVTAPTESCALCGEKWRKMSGNQCVCAGYKDDSECHVCPEHAICNGTKITSCDPDYYINGNVCSACPQGLSCVNGQVICGENSFFDGTDCVACVENASCATGSIQCNPNYYLDENVCRACPTCTNCSTNPSCSNNTITYGSCGSSSNVQWTQVVFNQDNLPRYITSATCRSCNYTSGHTTISKEECLKCSGERFLTQDKVGDPKCNYCGARGSAKELSGTNVDKDSCNACLNREYNASSKKCVCDANHLYNTNKCCAPKEVANTEKTGCVADCEADPNGCGAHGTCVNRICECTDGYTGSKCETSVSG